MKYCNTCETEKPLENFPNRTLKSGKIGKYHKCRDCTAKYDKEHYISKSRNLNRDNAVNIVNYLIEHGCVDCGEKDPIVLEFDHKRNKCFDISRRIRKSWASLEEEISKCEVRCANCHRKKTAKDYDWYSYIAYDENGKAYRKE